MSKVKRTGIMLNSCPNCSAIWGVGSEEWDWQQCGACGWPDDDGEDLDLDSGDDESDQFDDDDDRNDPNDSRNL